jgi:hypothetical protein
MPELTINGKRIVIEPVSNNFDAWQERNWETLCTAMSDCEEVYEEDVGDTEAIIDASFYR